MSLLAVALFLQSPEVEVKQKTPDVRLVVTADGTGLGALVVRKRSAALHSGAMIETWSDETSSLAGADTQKLKAEVKLSRPGTYELSLGPGSARVSISRASFSGWAEEVDSLRDTARKLQQIAGQIDAAKSPSGQQVLGWRQRLMAERQKIIKLKSDFTATHQALMDGIDRLYFHYSLLKVPDIPDGPVPEGYEPPQRKTGTDVNFPAANEVKDLLEIIKREATLKLVDELRVMIEADDREVRVVRWARPAEAYKGLREAHDVAGGPEELGDLLKEAQEGADPAGVLARAVKLRSTLVK